MAIQQVNLGATGTGAGGDSARTAFERLNANFSNPTHAASKLAQQSATDVTPGALMAVGAFGWGQLQGVANTIADANAALANGVYRVSSNTAGTMLGNLIGQTIHVEQNAGYAVQLAMSAQNPPTARMRVKNADAWGPPVSLLHTGNILGGVSQSGGVPTGAVIERGSNANGEYVRFADGTQICTLTIVVTDQAIDSPYGTLFTGTRTWTFPAPFSQVPAVPPPAFNWGTSASWGHSRSATATTNVVLRAIDIALRQAGTAVYIQAIAIGRWY